jgi:hypothetical protein
VRCMIRVKKRVETNSGGIGIEMSPFNFLNGDETRCESEAFAVVVQYIRVLDVGHVKILDHKNIVLNNFNFSSNNLMISVLTGLTGRYLVELLSLYYFFDHRFATLVS